MNSLPGFYSFDFEATGTKWVIDLSDQGGFDDFASLESAVKSKVASFEEKYSRFLKTSLVTKMSESGGNYVVDEEVKPMFDLYFDLERTTEGLFTPLIGSTLIEAGYDTDYSFVQRKFSPVSRLDEVCKYNFPSLELNQPVNFDFGAIGKGMLIDIVGNILKAGGVSNFCIDAGHDLGRYAGDFSEISVGLEHPTNPELAIGIYKLGNGSICGSSGNRRNWKNFHHIINPVTHKSTQEIVAVWVAAETAALADGLSTTLFLVEPDKLANNYKFEYMVVKHDMSMRKSAGKGFEIFL